MIFKWGSLPTLLVDWCQQLFLISLMCLSVYVLCKIPFPCGYRSSFSGTARSRHPVGANGLPCPSPSLWQTAGGRWGPVPLTTQAEARSDVWVAAWQTVSCSVCLCISLSFPPYLWPFSFICMFLCLSSYPCISDMSTDPCGVCFHKCHSLSAFLLCLPFTICLFFF